MAGVGSGGAGGAANAGTGSKPGGSGGAGGVEDIETRGRSISELDPFQPGLFGAGPTLVKSPRNSSNMPSTVPRGSEMSLEGAIESSGMNLSTPRSEKPLIGSKHVPSAKTPGKTSLSSKTSGDVLAAMNSQAGPAGAGDAGRGTSSARRAPGTAGRERSTTEDISGERRAAARGAKKSSTLGRAAGRTGRNKGAPARAAPVSAMLAQTTSPRGAAPALLAQVGAPTRARLKRGKKSGKLTGPPSEASSLGTSQASSRTASPRASGTATPRGAGGRRKNSATSSSMAKLAQYVDRKLGGGRGRGSNEAPSTANSSRRSSLGTAASGRRSSSPTLPVGPVSASAPATAPSPMEKQASKSSKSGWLMRAPLEKSQSLASLRAWFGGSGSRRGSPNTSPKTPDESSSKRMPSTSPPPASTTPDAAAAAPLATEAAQHVPVDDAGASESAGAAKDRRPSTVSASSLSRMRAWFDDKLGGSRRASGDPSAKGDSIASDDEGDAEATALLSTLPAPASPPPAPPEDVGCWDSFLMLFSCGSDSTVADGGADEGGAAGGSEGQETGCFAGMLASPMPSKRVSIAPDVASGEDGRDEGERDGYRIVACFADVVDWFASLGSGPASEPRLDLPGDQDDVNTPLLWDTDAMDAVDVRRTAASPRSRSRSKGKARKVSIAPPGPNRVGNTFSRANRGPSSGRTRKPPVPRKVSGERGTVARAMVTTVEKLHGLPVPKKITIGNTKTSTPLALAGGAIPVEIHKLARRLDATGVGTVDVGQLCEAIWHGDGRWYPAKVVSGGQDDDTGESQWTVFFPEHEEEASVGAAAIRRLGAPED